MKTLLVAALLLAAPLANAESILLSKDLAARNDGLLTLDTATGLEWLDVPTTVGLSVQDVLNDTGGWISAGFHLASYNELSTLFLDGGMHGNVAGDGRGFLLSMSGEDAAGASTATLLGPTSPSINRLNVFGNIATEPCRSGTECDNKGPEITFYIRLIATESLSWISVSDDSVDVDFHNSDTGNWLVRDSAQSVPEPGTMALFAFGAAAFAFTRRRRLVQPVL